MLGSLMITQIIWLLIKLFTVIALIVWFLDNPGQMSITWMGYQIQSSVGIALACLTIVLAGTVTVFYLYQWLQSAPKRLREWRRKRRDKRGNESVSKALVALASNEGNEALRQSRRALKLVSDTHVVKLIHAQALEAANFLDEAEEIYHSLLHEKGTAFLGFKGLSLIAQRRGDIKIAIAYLQDALELRPKSGWVVNEMLKLTRNLDHDDRLNHVNGFQHNNDVDHANGFYNVSQTMPSSLDVEDRVALLEKAVKLNLLKKEEALKEQTICLNVAANKSLGEGKFDDALAYANGVLKKDSLNIEATCLAARILNMQSQTRKALRLIEKVWRETPDPELARAYYDIGKDKLNEGQQNIKMERLAAMAPTHPKSLLVAAEVAIASGRFDEARNDLMSAYARDPNDPHTYHLLAKLEEKQHQDYKASKDWLRKGLQLNAPSFVIPKI